MTKVILNDLVNLENQTSTVNTINANNAVIETAFDNTLSRDGTFPNQMLANLDMNSFRILNLPEPLSSTEPLRKEDVTDFNTGLEALTSVVNGIVVGSGSAMVGITATGVIGTNIPAGVNSIQTSGYYAAGDGGEALYVKVSSLTAGYFGLTSLDGKIWQLSEEMVTPKMCGAHGNGVSIDTTAINAAKSHTQASTKTCGYTDGNYVIDATIEYAKSGYQVLALGSHVTITATHAGRAISFDGTSIGPNVVDQAFGGANPFYIRGNASTTDLLYTKLVNHSSFNVNVGNAAGSALRFDTVVCNKYNVICSTLTAVMATKPIFGVIGTGAFDCKFDTILEGVGSTGNYVLNLDNSFENIFWGTAESSIGGGVNIGPACFRNTFTGFDCEVNATGGGHEVDWLVQGYENTFIGCQGQLTYDGVHPANLILGNQNTFINCDFSGLTNGGLNNSYDACLLNVGFTDVGVNTRIRRCTGPADNKRNSSLFCNNTGTSVTTPGASQFMGMNGMNNTEFNVQMRMPCAGTLSNLFTQTTGSPGAGQTYTFFVRINGANQLLSTIINAGSSTASDTTHSVNVVAGDLVSLAVISSVSAAATNVIWSWQFNAA